MNLLSMVSKKTTKSFRSIKSSEIQNIVTSENERKLITAAKKMNTRRNYIILYIFRLAVRFKSSNENRIYILITGL